MEQEAFSPLRDRINTNGAKFGDTLCQIFHSNALGYPVFLSYRHSYALVKLSTVCFNFSNNGVPQKKDVPGLRKVLLNDSVLAARQ